MKNNIDRNSLEFQKAVKEHFIFLENQYEYRCVYSDLYSVKYFSEKAYFNIYHERISYELYFLIGILPEDYNSPLRANLRDIISFSGLVNEQVLYQASNKDSVNHVVMKLANFAKAYTIDLIKASVEDFREIENFRIKKQEKALHLLELEKAEQKAKNAWNIKDYRTVLEVYNQYIGNLNQIQLRRLDYVRKMLYKKEKTK